MDKTLEVALERLTEGAMLSQVAEELGLKRTTLYKRFQDAGLGDAYARAREEGLLVRGENLSLKAATPLPTLASGGIDPAAVSQLKLEIETEKWTLAKLASKIFGDRLDLNHSGEVTVNGLAGRMRQKRANSE